MTKLGRPKGSENLKPKTYWETQESREWIKENIDDKYHSDFIRKAVKKEIKRQSKTGDNVLR